jgi:hypothetical protein
MSKISNADLFSLIAHWEFVAGASQSIPEIKDFAAIYYKRNPPAKRKLIREWIKAKESARQSLVREFDKNGWGKTDALTQPEPDITDPT